MRTRGKRWTHVVSVGVIGALILGATSCGTILYPERRGQDAGKLDVGVVLLDGIGLLFFLVPGVIAFAVDFATGAIYLPGGITQFDPGSTILDDGRIVQLEPDRLTRRSIQEMVRKETGQGIDLASPEIRVARRDRAAVGEWRRIDQVLTPEQLEAFAADAVPASVR